VCRWHGSQHTPCAACLVGKTMVRLKYIAAAALLLALVAPGAVDAQQLLNQWVRSSGNRFRINLVGGRLVLRAPQFGNFESRTNSANVKELLRFRIENGQPAMLYEQTTAGQRLTINLTTSGDSVSIRREPREKSSVVAVEFTQSLKEKTSLTIGSGDRRQVFRASDLWRLLLAHPKQCQEHLCPLLEMLRPDWKLVELAAGVERSLLECARETAAAEHARLAALVEQLADDRFARREAADRALRTGGPAALRYLRRLDYGSLDAEQQFRIRRIIAALAGVHEDDSAEDAAASLTGDPLVWWLLLDRPEAATRRVAAEQLATLLGEPIQVDPAAEPSTQKQQREQLRTRIDGKPVAGE
jgi:hypothetical protein